VKKQKKRWSTNVNAFEEHGPQMLHVQTITSFHLLATLMSSAAQNHCSAGPWGFPLQSQVIYLFLSLCFGLRVVFASLKIFCAFHPCIAASRFLPL